MTKGTFLIVEDEFVVAENLRTEIESMGYEIVGMAFTGDEALELARQKRPDLVLMDIKLREGMDGIETAVHLRQELDIPSFFLTAFSNESLLERAKLAEPLGYLVKPFERNGLRASIEMAHYKARMEHLLKESESRFRAMFENSLVSMHTTDMNKLNAVAANDVAVELFGYKSQQDFKDNFNPRNHFVREKDIESNLKTLVEKGELSNRYQEMKKVDGTPFWANIFVKLNSDRNLARTVILDITEQMNAHQKVIDNELKFRNLFENSVVSILTIDLITAKVTEVNDVCVDIFGYKSKKDFIDTFHSTHHFISPKEREEFIDRLHENSELNITCELKKLDGTFFWANIFAKINHYKSEIQAVIIDITDSKRTHEELEAKVEERTLELTATLEREKELNEMKSRFVSTASHEFRTPLSAILSSVSIMELYNSEGLQEKRKKHLNRIKSSVQNLVDILNDFLSLDKLEQGKTEVLEEKFNMKDFSEDIVEEMQGMLKPGQHIDFSFTGKKEITKDKKILRNVILNLLSNAIKYSGEDKSIEFTIEINKKEVIIKVKDYGIGIPVEEQKHLFGKFYRATNATNIQGTGLGLNIVKKYIELLEGSISFESRPAIGTTFTVVFTTI